MYVPSKLHIMNNIINIFPCFFFSTSILCRAFLYENCNKQKFMIYTLKVANKIYEYLLRLIKDNK